MQDHPVHGGIGGLQPAAMERNLLLIDQELAVVDLEVSVPCNASGAPA